jgi:prepilin-type N-terminal cleavage/methylation domain-containing protein
MKLKNFKGGFTLIELLVVIAIIGILSSVVLVSLNSARQKGKDTHIVTDVNELRTQMESDSNGSNYGNSFTIAAGAVSFGNAISGTYAQLGTDATANALQIGSGANVPYSVYGSGALLTGQKAWNDAANAPVIVINENGAPGAGAAWTTAPTAYSIWGHQANGTYFCIDSTGGTKAGTNAVPTTITCQ